MPRSTRPFDSQSIVVTDFAVYTGLRCGTSNTPVPSLTFVVTAARNDIAANGSINPTSGRAGNRPLSR